MRKVSRLKKVGKPFKEAIRKQRIQLAMLIDTDGSINATKHGRPHVKVGMSSKMPVILWKLWGGYISKRKEPGKKVHYEWEINERVRVRAVLLTIKHYLQLKQPQARLALKMIDLLENKPEGYEQKLKLLAKELSRLNHAPSPDIDLEKFVDTHKREVKR